MRATFFLLLAILAWSGSTSAQTPISGPAQSVLFNTARLEASDTVTAEIKPTYWKEGALIAGIAGAAGGAFLGYGLCEQSEDASLSCGMMAVLGGLGGALLLAIPGALIGGQFEKGGGMGEGGTAVGR